MNPLYPIFLKTTKLNILIVGGGFVALEKLTFLLKSSPDSNVKIIAPFIIEEVYNLIKNKKNIEVELKLYDSKDIRNNHIVIATTNNINVNVQIYNDCKQQNILINVADNPQLCDFYMGSIVTKGNLKVAISTNGKSPTLAKTLRELLEDIIPENIDNLLDNINKYRETLKVSFQEKVEILNNLTKILLNKNK